MQCTIRTGEPRRTSRAIYPRTSSYVLRSNARADRGASMCVRIWKRCRRRSMGWLLVVLTIIEAVRATGREHSSMPREHEWCVVIMACTISVRTNSSRVPRRTCIVILQLHLFLYIPPAINNCEQNSTASSADSR